MLEVPTDSRFAQQPLGATLIWNKSLPHLITLVITHRRMHAVELEGKQRGKEKTFMSYNPGFLQQLAGGCQLISCLIMLLLLARLSSEMRCVTAAAEMFPSALALPARPL